MKKIETIMYQLDYVYFGENDEKTSEARLVDYLNRNIIIKDVDILKTADYIYGKYNMNDKIMELALVIYKYFAAKYKEYANLK